MVSKGEAVDKESHGFVEDGSKSVRSSTRLVPVDVLNVTQVEFVDGTLVEKQRNKVS